MTQPNLKDVFEKNQYNLADAAKKSRSWLNNEVLALSKQRITARKTIYEDPDALQTRIVPGNLYLYMYDPKTKDTLPYYDMFPLVFPYARTKDGFIGLNMHYLPYDLRLNLLDRLMKYASNTRLNEHTKIKYSWQLIKDASGFQAARPCIKQYLSGHVRSPFRKIESSSWATAMLLPVEKFVGATNAEVWKDSRKIIRRA